MPEIERTITREIRSEVREIKGERLFRLRRPISIETSYDGDAWVSRIPELGILSFGSTPQESLESFAEDFEALYEELSSVSDNDLTPRAVIAKRFLSATIWA
jgi:hypothetical protein